MLKFYSKIIAGIDSATIYQSLALVIFFIFFVGLIYMVMSKPKNYYSEISSMPLDEENKQDKDQNTVN
ncbi:CcoQ/FixQ family Cbb3-type cytochrome c oxidase assembly chaperone [Apibacter muscae]|uniref:CcoQ/FixQ family Cbb3-type cytochrome c oxidase assembly chaperone n=1 Tax=Apibacter muscae TaxID=2509004 RepID=A0A563DIE8_9FLAO|nr:CcoQ/FixQ family Cbb3-type cytochrome c oxidase assembly chaperone [Apibacter muscae]TWP24738.1 CcoQ/FixQ family Cbb3-type cytochrome c oxidase assembly chaperone [Apibacter muscae]TWP29791.1 CcoQ/FixQ family Cbb3-type cytochrome c oxidase assembly chaperone [Apibacter muscae]TWP30939.1 CcoQ/FixQ family Cbb3-type cytochrome c oxidase assembly chaperone [Apibacter muscae]